MNPIARPVFDHGLAEPFLKDLQFQKRELLMTDPGHGMDFGIANVRLPKPLTTEVFFGHSIGIDEGQGRYSH